MCRHVFHVLFVYHLKSNCNQIVISRLEFIFSEQKSTKKHSVIVYKYNIAHKISHYNTKYIIILYHIIVVLFCVTLFCVILYYFVLYCSPGIPYPPWSPPPMIGKLRVTKPHWGGRCTSGSCQWPLTLNPARWESQACWPRRPGPGLVRGQGPPRRRWRSGRAPASDHLYTG
jgi:hypothetical protein